MDKQQLETTVTKVLDEMRERPIPLGISIVIFIYALKITTACFPITLLVRKRAAAARTICSRPDRHAGGTKRSVKKCALTRPTA